MAELEAIVADYLEQAAIWDVIPAAGCAALLAEAREPRTMIDRHHFDPAERAELSEPDLAIATLVGRYVERREGRRDAPRARPARGRRRVRRHGRRCPAHGACLLRAMRAYNDLTT